MSQNEPIYFGVDFARKQDYTAVIGLDYLGQVAYFDRFGADKSRFSYDDITERVAHAIQGKHATCDGTGVGDALIETLAAKVGSTIVDTFLFTNKSKVGLIESLAVAIQNAEISIPNEDSGGKVLFDELYNFEAQYSPTGLTTYNAPDGQHDDCVIALGLAWHCFKTYSSYQTQGSSILYIGEA
jgi:phage FluMu gp28-like protein